MDTPLQMFTAFVLMRLTRTKTKIVMSLTRGRPALFLVLTMCQLLLGVRMFGVESQRRISVILISVDTLRADHLGCYGYQDLRTPHIDILAQEGTVFAQVSSQVPLTLPSHVSLLTSTYPFANGVEDNGEQLGPDSVTLATVLKSRGYRTAAFIGGFVLDRRFGLGQGFDFYDSPASFLQKPGQDPGTIKRPAAEVVSSALQWLGKNSERPFFLFLHLYDLHTPYEMRPALRGHFPVSSYDAELDYVDEQVGRFFDFLIQHKLVDHSLIVFVSDHGESLGEHGESTHGYFTYQATLRVPLIFHWPHSSGSFPRRIEEPVGLLDVAPTILQFVDVPLPGSFQGRSLLGSLHGNVDRQGEGVYSESLYPARHSGASSLRCLRVGSYKYIDAPKPELYDLARDPREVLNLYGSHQPIALSLRERLIKLMTRFPAKTGEAHFPAPSPETAQLLASLGYVASSGSDLTHADSGPDPKDRIVAHENYGHALVLASAGRLAEANTMLEQLLSQDPTLPDVQLSLGLNQQRLGQYTEAARSFHKVLERNPQDVLAHFDLGVSYFELGQLDDAAQELQVALQIAPYYTRAGELLGTIWLQKKEYERARLQFKQVLDVDPSDYGAHYNLGVLATMEGKVEEGERHLQSALRTDPSSADAHNALGSLYLRQHHLEQARLEFEEAVRLQPQFTWAHYNLGLVLRTQKQDEKATEEFRQALAADPDFQPARDALELLQERQK